MYSSFSLHSVSLVDSEVRIGELCFSANVRHIQGWNAECGVAGEWVKGGVLRWFGFRDENGGEGLCAVHEGRVEREVVGGRPPVK